MNQKTEVVKDDLQYLLDLVQNTQNSVFIDNKEIAHLLLNVEKVCKRSIRVLEGQT